MLKVIQISVLVDTDAIDGPYPQDFSSSSALTVMELLSNPKRRRLESGRRVPVVLDSVVEDQGEVISELEDSVVNDTYVSGEAFSKKWVWYSPSEQTKTGFGYWSASMAGYEDQSLATRFLPLRSEAEYVLGDRSSHDMTIMKMD